ncbi:MAG: hypothetical protein WBH75_00985 [Thermoanaerobaculia bacterium]
MPTYVDEPTLVEFVDEATYGVAAVVLRTSSLGTFSQNKHRVRCPVEIRKRAFVPRRVRGNCVDGVDDLKMIPHQDVEPLEALLQLVVPILQPWLPKLDVEAEEVDKEERIAGCVRVEMVRL